MLNLWKLAHKNNLGAPLLLLSFMGGGGGGLLMVVFHAEYDHSILY